MSVGTATKAHIACVLLSVAIAAQGGEVDARFDTAPLFSDDAVIDVRIEAPLTTLMAVRPDEDYLDGTFSYLEPGGTTRTLSLKLRTRGSYRRDPEHCDFAPIKLNLKVGELADTLFAGQDKLKLVTHCQLNNARYEQLVAREYVAYRLLRELTDISYSVRMFRITWVDTERDKEIRRLGFVIEDDEAVARRNGLQVARVERVLPGQLDPGRQNLVHVFEYMIGNTEYSLVTPEPGKECCHNMDVLVPPEGPPYLPLPFDFDFSGFVNAHYAQPNPRYPIASVRTRFYKGVCSNNELLPDTLRRFFDKRDALEDVINDTSFLSPRSRRSVRQYLNSFFRQISSPESGSAALAAKCREPGNSYSPTVATASTASDHDD